MSDSKETYRKLTYNLLRKSMGRIQTFIEAEMNQFVVRELLMMMDRMHVLDPDQYASAIKTYKLGALKKERGVCTDEECYNALVPPLEAIKMQSQDDELANCLEWYCPEHAKQAAEESRFEEMEGNKYESEDN